jgi:hypothetical protein
MKKIKLQLLLFIASLSVSIVSCKKESATNGPDITYLTSGFLCTIGVAMDRVIDTLVVVPVSGLYGVHLYGYGLIRDRDELLITNNSNGTVAVKLKTPYAGTGGPYTHIGLYGSNLSISQGIYHRFDFKKGESAETEFIIRRNAGDGKMFTLESKAVPGSYMSTEHPGVNYQPNSTMETRLVFSGKKQEFFFLPK